jgi:hypothetical protein
MNNFFYYYFTNALRVILFLKGAFLPFIISVVVLLFTLRFSTSSILELIELVVDLIVTIIPSLLGFVLGGYAILIGISNIAIVSVKIDSNLTLYQKISTVFSISLIMQLFLLVFAFIVKFVLKSNVPVYSTILADSINYITLILLFFGFVYVNIMIKDLVINIFNLSQYQNFKANQKQK